MATKVRELALAQARRPRALLEAELPTAPPLRDFLQSLLVPGGVGIIAEVKKASPSAGILRADFDPIQIADIYSRHGAGAISVLTDVDYFQGSLEFLQQIRMVNPTPLLRKEFIISEYQVIEARVAGADSVLLIAEILSPGMMKGLCLLAKSLGMRVLIELHEAEHLNVVLAAEPDLLGINNRNLRTFETRLEHTIDLMPQIPSHVPVVSE
ncbi:MAG: indole-3-glycerol phosphate synthase TrpC, partial [Gemmataceae bacterium]